MRINQNNVAFEAYRNVSLDSAKKASTEKPASASEDSAPNASAVNARQVAVENVSASGVHVKGPDMALRLAELASNQIRQDPGSALLGQASGLAESAIKLLR